MEPSAFSGPRLAPPISDTADTAATATHHQCPPNQPGWESSYHLPPNLITPMNTSPANAKIGSFPVRLVRGNTRHELLLQLWHQLADEPMHPV